MNDQSVDTEVTMGLSTDDESARADRVAALLAGGVPLALLADLAESGGPLSPAILESEGLPDDAWWEKGDEGTAAAGNASGDQAHAEVGDASGDPADEDPDLVAR